MIDDPVGLLSTTPDGLIVDVNGTFLELTGFERADLVGRRRFAELLGPGGRIYHETHYAPMLRMHGAATEIALEIVRADGTRLSALVNSVLERDAGGEPVAVRTAVFEASHRRAYERELLLAKQRAEESEQRATELAHTLQRTLIPPAPPVIPGLDLVASYRPAGAGDQVGGDFYDVFEVGAGDWAVVVGDVRGKGVEAAVVTALVRYTVRAATVRHDEPSAGLRTGNDVLLRDPTDRFCTVALVRLRQTADGWTACLTSGGHPLPVLVPAGERARPVGRPGTLLGVFDEVTLYDESVELGAGDSLVLYTDGITEARRGRTFFEERGLLAAVDRHRDAEDLSAAVVEEALAHQGDEPGDDIVVVAATVR